MIYRIIDDIYPGIAEDFIYQTSILMEGEPVSIEICSYGGDLFAGVAISNRILELIDESHTVECKIYGLAASSAALIALSCEKIGIAESALIMIHSAWSENAENSDDISIANAVQEKILLKRIKNGVDFRRDVWISSGEALERGIVDYIFASSRDDASRLAALYVAAGNSLKKEGKIMDFRKKEDLQADYIEPVPGAVEIDVDAPDRRVEVEDVLEAIVRRMDALERRMDAMERENAVQAECDGKDRLTAMYRELTARVAKPSMPAPLSAHTDGRSTEEDLLKRHERSKRLYGDAALLDSKAAVISK